MIFCPWNCKTYAQCFPKKRSLNFWGLENTLPLFNCSHLCLNVRVSSLHNNILVLFLHVFYLTEFVGIMRYCCSRLWIWKTEKRRWKPSSFLQPKYMGTTLRHGLLEIGNMCCLGISSLLNTWQAFPKLTKAKSFSFRCVWWRLIWVCLRTLPSLLGKPLAHPWSQSAFN